MLQVNSLLGRFILIMPQCSLAVVNVLYAGECKGGAQTRIWSYANACGTGVLLGPGTLKNLKGWSSN
jgi:hypothetical protein